jgi:membrane-bound lytic murein transglycosylase B
MRPDMRPNTRPYVALLIASLGLAACSSDDNATTATEVAPTTSSSSTNTTAPIGTTETTIAQADTMLDGVLDVGDFADGLTIAERTIRDPSTPPDQIEQAGVHLQLLIRTLADQPELDESVIAGVGDDVRPTIERIIRARQFVQARSAADPTPAEPSITLPAWTIVEPLPADQLLAYYAEAETLTGVPWYWLAAIHLQETRMGRIVGVSSAGAVGPMQFLPTTWAECCTGDPLDTRDAIIGAATYLVQGGAPTDMAAALYHYNPNEGYVAVVTAYGENIRDVPALYHGYHAFQVFYSSAAGTVRLPIGFSQTQPVDAATYLRDHPEDAA